MAQIDANINGETQSKGLVEKLLSDLKNITQDTDREDIVTIECQRGNQKRFAHRSVLIVSSTYFASHLKQPSTTLSLPVTPEVFDLVLDFIYTNRFSSVEPRHAIELFVTAERFFMTDFVDVLKRYLEINLKRLVQTSEFLRDEFEDDIHQFRNVDFEAWNGLDAETRRYLDLRILKFNSEMETPSSQMLGTSESPTSSSHIPIYILESRGDIFQIRDLESQNTMKCKANLAHIYCANAVIHRNKVFRTSIKLKSIFVFDLMTTENIQQIPLRNPRLEFFKEELYAYTDEGEVYTLEEQANNEFCLQFLTSLDFPGIKKMCIIRKTDDEFVTAQQMKDCIALATVHKNAKRITLGTVDGQSLVGCHNEHIFVTKFNVEKQNLELLDIHEYSVIRRFPIDNDGLVKGMHGDIFYCGLYNSLHNSRKIYFLNTKDGTEKWYEADSCVMPLPLVLRCTNSS